MNGLEQDGPRPLLCAVCIECVWCVEWLVNQRGWSVVSWCFLVLNARRRIKFMSLD
jgi:hypothetical protein